jgi:glucose-6-phosphate 1-dehydrogenase
MSMLQPFELVIFGGTGDLSLRKLLPSMYYSHRDGNLPDDCRIVCLGQSIPDRAGFLVKAKEGAQKFLPAKDYDEAAWDAFAEHLDYLKLNASNLDDYKALADKVNAGGRDTRVFYLSLPPSVFGVACENLAAVGLNQGANTRVVLEKPLGYDFASADVINSGVARFFNEKQVYRIDHYLGKEPVQNLMALRFGNTFFEPLWRREWISDVQITVAETVGVETRAAFYDGTGALRDMVQNHLLQLLLIIAMEPPVSAESDAIRDEKLKVLHSLRQFTEADVANKVVFGQYKAGQIAGKQVPAYLDEPGVPADSRTETFVAIKAEVDNWRWAGVPFFLRTGKRMQERLAEIVINFKAVPHPIFGGQCVNRLVIQLQPDECVKLYLMAKQPGDGMHLGAVNLNVDFSDAFKVRQMEAYERMLLDALRGKQTLFVRRDESDAAWRWVAPIMDYFKSPDVKPKPYPAGSWGPAAANTLTLKDGLTWAEEN